MTVPILKQGDLLIVSVQAALTDRDVVELKEDLADNVGRSVCRTQRIYFSCEVLMDYKTISRPIEDTKRVPRQSSPHQSGHDCMVYPDRKTA